MIYLDSAASALPFEDAVTFSPEPGNPSSDHSAGYAANAVLEKTRSLLSAMFGGRSSEYHFCSGATEAANLIIQGRCHFLKTANSTRNEIIVSAIEHPAIFNTVKHMRQSGFIVHIAPVDHRGIIETSFIYDLLNEHTSMVLVMGVNNETGARQPIDDIAKKVKTIDPDISFICDGVQTLTKVSLPRLNVYRCPYWFWPQTRSGNGGRFFLFESSFSTLPFDIWRGAGGWRQARNGKHLRHRVFI